MPERVIRANGLDIWTETFGDPANPAVLLAMGAGAQGVGWRPGFCGRLADRGLFVVRYDHRDVGLSSRVDFDLHPYTLDDLASDAVEVLNGWRIPAAHVAGASMGGMVCQVLALKHRQRVKSLTSIMSSPLAGTGADNQELAGGHPTELPPPSETFIQKAGALFGRPPDTADERIERAVELHRHLAGSFAPYDAAERRAIAALEESRGPLDRGDNHGRAVTASAPADRRTALRGLDLPALVIHGTEDPILRYAHGRATAEAIPGARMLSIEGLGHELPIAVWPLIIDAIAELVAKAERGEPAPASAV